MYYSILQKGLKMYVLACIKFPLYCLRFWYKHSLLCWDPLYLCIQIVHGPILWSQLAFYFCLYRIAFPHQITLELRGQLFLGVCMVEQLKCNQQLTIHLSSWTMKNNDSTYNLNTYGYFGSLTYNVFYGNTELDVSQLHTSKP